jgi:hypothetical protein
MFINGRFVPRSICLFIEGDDPAAGGGTDLSKVLESFNSKLAKYNNDAAQLAQQLFTENYTLREDKRKLSSKLQEAEGKAPAEGSLVLSGDDAKAWNSITELNLSPDEIKAKLQSSSDTEKELAGLKRTELMRQIADAEGYKATVLSDILPDDAPVEFKDHEKDGQKKKRAFIKIKENGADRELLLSEYLETNKADYLPALRVEQATNNKYVRQESSGKPLSNNPYDQIREEAKQRQEAQKTDSKPLSERLGMASR